MGKTDMHWFSAQTLWKVEVDRIKTLWLLFKVFRRVVCLRLRKLDKIHSGRLRLLQNPRYLVAYFYGCRRKSPVCCRVFCFDSCSVVEFWLLYIRISLSLRKEVSSQRTHLWMNKICLPPVHCSPNRTFPIGQLLCSCRILRLQPVLYFVPFSPR